MTAGRPTAQRRSYYPSRAEKGVCWAVLLLLGAVALGVGLRQRSFNPAVLVARNPGPALDATAAPATTAASEVITPLAPGLVPFGAAERFSPDNLYDKIDGKAELYLAAGFVEMRCQRFALQGAPDEWLEFFIYNMGELPRAFSVFSTQRRSEGEALELSPYAYRTRNGLYFVSGSNYVEVVAATTNEPLRQATLAMARLFVNADPAAQVRLTQLNVFPAEHLLPGSQTLQIADAFGFDQFKNVFAAQYKIGGAEAMAFICRCPDASSAEALAAAYRAFLTANGGKEVPGSPGVGVRIDIMDGIELIFAEGSVVGGVHNAQDAGAAEQVARQLRERLAASSTEAQPK